MSGFSLSRGHSRQRLSFIIINFGIEIVEKINQPFESMGKLFILSQSECGLVFTLTTMCVLFLSQAFNKPEVGSLECFEKKKS